MTNILTSTKIIHTQGKAGFLTFLSFYAYSFCMNVRYTSFLLLFLQFYSTADAQPDWTAVKAKMEANTPLLGKEYAFVLATEDSVLLLQEKNGFTLKTQVPIASSSKWLTAVLLYKLAEEGKLNLDDPVAQYLPSFSQYFKNYITIRQCLSHMTGIEEKATLRSLLQRKKYFSLEEEVEDMAQRAIRAKPGTDFWYGNTGMNIAGRIAEVVTKKKFDILIKTKVFTPLGMRKTSFSQLDGGPLNPAGGAVSTTEDLLKFLQMFLRKGKTETNAVFLSESSVEELLKLQASAEQVSFAPASAKGYGYAQGAWVVESINGNATALASPGLFGSWPMIDLCRGYVYIVLVKNILSEERASVHKEMKDLIDRQLTNVCQ
jgi:CubicO group peptidase (beta-lactamase class C family)